ncbi:hypothetical protein [Phormidium nigroviride]
MKNIDRFLLVMEMKLSFSRVHSLFLIGTAALAIAMPSARVVIAHPLVAEASTVLKSVPRNDIISKQRDSRLIEKSGNIYAQRQDNPPKDESAGGSR